MVEVAPAKPVWGTRLRTTRATLADLLSQRAGSLAEVGVYMETEQQMTLLGAKWSKPWKLECRILNWFSRPGFPEV